MKTLSIDIETYSDQNLVKTGVYRYSAEGYLTDKLTEHSVVISKAQGLELLRKRGYIFKDDLPADSA